MKNKKVFLLLIILFISSFTIMVSALEEDPDFVMPIDDPEAIKHVSNNNLSKKETISDKTFTSSVKGETALTVTNSKVTLINPTIKKTGDEQAEAADHFGTNAGVFVYKKGILYLKNGTINTDGQFANALFSYDTGTVNIYNTTIKTLKRNSAGIMVSYGGKIEAKDLTVVTNGSESSAIKSDINGGTINVYNGSYTTNGIGSPVVYSTGKININNAKLKATNSEGVVVEGYNSLTLNKVDLNDSNTKLYGKAETYKNIFMYRNITNTNEGVATFKANNSKIKTYFGDTIFVTNLDAKITLNNNTIENTSGNFLRVSKSKWGKEGLNGGHVNLDMIKQEVTGNIIVDSISSLSMNLEDNSFYKGTINNSNEASTLSITLDLDSILELTGDSYITSLDNEDENNSNIYLNGHKLYLNGKEVDANEGKYKKPTTNKKVEEKSISFFEKYLVPILIVSGFIIITLIIIIFVAINNKRNNRF